MKNTINKPGGQELAKLAQKYIIGCIDTEGYDTKANTEKEKVKFLWDTFHAEYGCHMEMGWSFQKSIAEYFAGLPTCCTIAFYNWDILEIAKKWGSLPENPTEKQEDKILDNWFNFMAMKTIQLFTKYGLR